MLILFLSYRSSRYNLKTESKRIYSSISLVKIFSSVQMRKTKSVRNSAAATAVGVLRITSAGPAPAIDSKTNVSHRVVLSKRWNSTGARNVGDVMRSARTRAMAW